MKRYYDEYTTPLKYHKFLKYASIPISILLLLFVFAGKTVSVVGEEDTRALLLFAADEAMVLAQLVLLCLTLYGFYTWRPCGFWCILIYYGVSLVYNLGDLGATLLLAFAGFLPPGSVASSLGSVLSSTLVGVLGTIY